MSNKFTFKKSSVPGKVPLAADLDAGEIAINLTDKLLYSKDTLGNVFNISGALAATAPIVTSGGNNPTISITPATTIAAGSLSASDKIKIDGITSGAILSGTNTGDETLATIKSKLGVSTLSGSNTGDQTITLTGGVTGSGTGSFAATVVTNANLTGEVTSVGNATTIGNAPVITKVLTGYVSGAGIVAPTDSILTAIQKLNGNQAAGGLPLTGGSLSGALSVNGLFSVVSPNLSTLDANFSGIGEAYNSAGAISSRNPYANAGTQMSWVASANSVATGYLVDINVYNAAGAATGVYFGATAGLNGNGPANFVIGRRTGTQTWAESFRIDTNGDTQLSGNLSAPSKSFLISHPTKPGKQLRYGSLESPYHGVRLTGEATVVNGECTVSLPDYIHELVKQEGSQVQITNIKHGKVIWVEDIDVNSDSFSVKCDFNMIDKMMRKEFKFYWSFTAIRKDIADLVVEC